MRIIDPFDQEAAKPQGIIDPFDTQEAPAPEEESGFLRQVADVPVGVSKGAVQGVRMIADAFGANNAVSSALRGAEDYLGGLMSAQAKNDQQEIARIMKEAEDKGMLDQVVAGVKAFAVAPVDLISQAFGTVGVTVAGGLAANVARLATAGRALTAGGMRATQAGIGTGMGAGAVKGEIYETVKQELQAAGVPEELAEERAQTAQSYGGENLDQILLGAGLGAVAASTGAERILSKIGGPTAARSIGQIAGAGVAEAVPEFLQGSQEQLAKNIALQREGFDVPTMRGVVGAGTLEAAAGAGVGAGARAITGPSKDEGPRTKEDEQIDALRNLQPEDMGEVVTPEEPRGADTREVRDDAGRGEPSVSVPAGDIAPAAGVVEPEAGGVGGPSPDVVETPAGEGAVDTALEQQIVDPFAETPAPVAETIAETPAPTPAEKPQPSLSLTPSASIGLTDLMRQEDPKLQAKFEEIRTGKKKVFKEYAPVVEDMQRTVDELSEFVRQQGVDPTDLASLRDASPEVQGAARLLSALGQDANNLTLAVKNQELNYARAKTPEAKAEVTDAVPKRKLADAQETIRLAREFMADPSKGTGDIVFSGVREVPPGTRGSEARLVREAVGQVVADWENAPRVEVVQSISELPGYMRDQITRDKVNPQGAYDPVSNLVFLVGDNLRGREDVFTTIAHESLGHFGLRSILGDSYKRVMNEIYNGHKEVKAAADKKMEDSPNMSREIAVEEVLAEMAETSPKPTPALRRLFDAIRRFARRIGIPLKSVTDGELQQLVANASRYVRRNELKFDRFTEGQVQPGGPRAVKGNKAVEGVEAVFSQGFKSEAGPNLQNPGKAPSKMQQLADGRPVWDKVKGAFNLKSIPSLPPTAKQGMYKILTLRMLKDIAGKRLPQMARAITVSEQMVAERSRIMRDGADILDKVQTLRKQKNGEKQVKLLGELAVQATMLETDPDPNSKFHKANKVLTDAWNTLTPEAQQIYKEMRGFYENQIDGMVTDMVARVDRNVADPLKRAELRKEIMEEFGPANRKGPYFPLRRFGNYWFQVGSGADKEFYMFESVGDRDFWMAERQKELVDSGRQDLADSIGSGDSIREGTNSLNDALASEPIMKKVEKMIDDAAIDLANPAKKARAVDELKDGIKQLQYLLLPSTNLRKAFIHRKGIAGASPDIVRVFSTSAVNLAYQRARVKYSEQFYNNIENGFAFLEGAPNNAETRATRDLLNELDSRTGHILGLEPSGAAEKAANGVTQFSFLWLLTAPASAMVNVFGAGAVAMPYIGARYGYDKAMARIADYTAKYVATAPKAMEGNTVFPTLDKSTSLDPLQAAAYQQFLHDNTIDVSLTQDIMGLGQAPFEEYSLSKNKLVRGVSALFHHSERMSREIMNMAAFDLAYADNVKKGMAPGVGGQAFTEAIETAKDLTMMSIGDFTRASKPPILTGPLTRIMFQFKQYSLLMTYNILRNTMIGFDPRRANLTEDQKAEAREARRRMYGVMGVTALFAGLKGMPIFTATSMMAEVLNSVFGDDEEEEFVFEYWLQKELADTVGGDAAAALMTGLISNATNTALSERMSLDLIDLWFRDGTYQKSAEDTMKEQFLMLLGPSVSIAMSFGKATDLYNNYQPERALETISPTILRNLQIVGRYMREGEAATARGITIDDDISYSDLFVRALGFTPEDIMRKQKAMIDRKGVETKIEARRERLLAGLYMALHFGDQDLHAEVVEKIQEFNESFPEVAITYDTYKKSLERKIKDKQKQEALGGVSEKLYGRIEGAIPTRD